MPSYGCPHVPRPQRQPPGEVSDATLAHATRLKDFPDGWGDRGKPHYRPRCERDRNTVQARAVVGQPSIVLADEPTANLDTATSLDLIALMRQLNEEKDATFFFATHDNRLLDRVNRLITLVDGKVANDEVVRTRKMTKLMAAA